MKLSFVIDFVKKSAGIILLIISLLAGLSIYGDYGITWDDPMQRKIGEVTYNYVFSGDKAFNTFNERDYGVAFELPLILVEKAFNIKDSRDIYLMRHLATHLFFLLGAFFFYLLINKLFRNKFLAVSGFLLLVLNPLLYSHSFFNTKDIPFLSMFIICFYIAAVAFERSKMYLFLLLGVACGLLTNLRIMGILLVGCIALFLLFDIIGDIKHKKLRNKNIVQLLLFLAAFCSTLFITWPYLWGNPVHNFISAFRNMSLFRQEVPVLYFGQLIKAPELSRLYSIVWFFISTPLIFLGFGVAGMAFWVHKFIKQPGAFLKNNPERNNLFYLACFLVPLLAVIILRSVLYDGWRQLFFIYPSFIMFAVFGLSRLLRTKARYFAVILLFAGFFASGFFMVKNHPFQYVYFNQLVSGKQENHFRKNFDMDYWGVSYKQSLEYILRIDPSDTIKFCVGNYAAVGNQMILKPDQRKRLRVSDEKEADYFITNYRWHPDDYNYPKTKLLHSFFVSNNAINSIYKLK